MDPGRARIGHPRSAPDTRATGLSGAAAAYRGHLFADLRGYTSFIERAGNAAAVELIATYRDMVRDRVARHGGAEIKTEGDSFYVVFPSASSAVLCALAIVEAAEKESEERPDRPIHVGIGVHAGEVVEHDDTFVGTAVNIAARVCAVAEPGEVLATATVKGVTQGSIPVTFTPRGRKKLKGIADPVELFAVTEPGKEVVRGRTPDVPRWMLGLVGAAAVVVLLLFGAYTIGMMAQPAGNVSPPAGTEPGVTPPPLVFGDLAIGQYRAAEFLPPFSLSIAEPGWQAYRVESDAEGLTRKDAPKGNLDVGKVRGLLTEPCLPEGPAISPGQTPEELMDAVKNLLYLHPDEQKELTVGDFEGKSMTFLVDQGAMSACGGFGPGDVAIFKIGTENWSATPGELVKLNAISVNGQTVSVLMTGNDPTGAVQSAESFFDRADQILQSLKF